MTFAVVVAIAFAVEASLGFGGTLIAVALGALFFPVEVIVPALLPLNMIMSTGIALRDRRHIAWRELYAHVLPWMAIGLPVGLIAFRAIDLRVALGVVLLLLSALRRLRAPRTLLVAAGVVHGALGTGGPLVVAALGDRLEKRAFRSTLAVLWMVLNVILLIGFVIEDRLDWRMSLQGLGGLVVGAVIGELVFRRVKSFERIIWIALAVTGIVLIVRG